MRSTLVLLIMVVIGIPSFAQINFPMNEYGEIVYEKVVEVQGKSKEQLHQLSRQWIAEVFRSANDVIQYENEETGVIIGKGNFQIKPDGVFGPIHPKQAGSVRFKVEIASREGRYKIKMTDFYHELSEAQYSGGSLLREKPACGTFYMSKVCWNAIKEQTDRLARATIVASENNIKSKNDSIDDW